MTLILGIESSCDETAVALVDDTRRIHANIIRTQYEEHAPYRGVVPEIAARAHMEWMEPILQEALNQAQTDLSRVDAIAVTAGPGLIGGVIVGVMTAKTICSVTGKPLIGVNHLEGHALTPRLSEAAAFPYLLLLVSGGHCFYAIAHGVGDYEYLGGTRDDALGEAFDKCAKMLGLPYPGGPQIERLAAQGNPRAFAFPRPLQGTTGCDFSFSGLKTAVRYTLQSFNAQPRPAGTSRPPLGGEPGRGYPNLAADIAASFQQAVIDILLERSERAINMASQRGYDALRFVVTGGVAANQSIGEALRGLAQACDMPFVAPPPALCTDNAAMIAWAGLERFHKGLVDTLALEPRARWPLSTRMP